MLGTIESSGTPFGNHSYPYHKDLSIPEIYARSQEVSNHQDNHHQRMKGKNEQITTLNISVLPSVNILMILHFVVAIEII